MWKPFFVHSLYKNGQQAWFGLWVIVCSYLQDPNILCHVYIIFNNSGQHPEYLVDWIYRNTDSLRALTLWMYRTVTDQTEENVDLVDLSALIKTKWHLVNIKSGPQQSDGIYLIYYGNVKSLYRKGILTVTAVS